jgi:hypothetical protein
MRDAKTYGDLIKSQVVGGIVEALLVTRRDCERIDPEAAASDLPTSREYCEPAEASSAMV